MTTLLLADHDKGQLSAETAKALTAAKALGADVHLLVVGADGASVAEAAAGLDGVAKVLTAGGDALAHQLAEPVAALLVSLAGDYDAIVAASSTSGKNVLPRVAALLDMMQISDVTSVEGPDTFKRPTYAGNAIETVRTSDAKRIMTIRTSSFEAAGSGADAAPIEAVSVSVEQPGLSSFVSEELATSERPELGSATVVVSGGRALGSSEKFKDVIMPLADKLNAAVGASRAAVDAGYAPNDWQVGQTGKVVAPELYIACGISGAIQHLAGMKDSKVIVAINKDEEAPIFQVADYGLVGDLFELVPELTSKV
ncbi:electron transfer flavoprotein subunit alpha/FixB family protein [Fulvimarina endophytica]|uniref:Electron transfer flavoprotein subunit alpha n=1 Tax=Fulvimarina endophytica TaxID=2293836 RepID=A0A371X0C1_9HYPH|nr:FAD-binding protein [Fulvimarina endophytica]RFC62484.1 electron transfer flavoprotein subunit alpha/FixB family protein [Fulvimarina endophytica]